MLPPGSGAYTPVRIFISVLLPAPFSPASASTSPRRTSRFTRSSALTPGNVLEMLRISRNGVTAWLPGSMRKLLRVTADVVFRHDRHAGIDVFRLPLLAIDLCDEMFYGELSH